MHRTSKRMAFSMAGLLLVSFLAAMPTVAAEEETPLSWGIEYEWVNLNDDILELTGMPYEEMITDIEESADYAGIDLDIINVYSGTSSIYVEQWDDPTEQQVSDNSGEEHTVTSRITELTLRHGMLYDAGLLLGWEDNSTMGAPALDMVLSADYETVVTMDVLYTEYVTSDMKLVGADMDASASWEIGVGMGFYADVAGNGESIEVDLDTAIAFGWDADSLVSEWRLDHPSNILNMMNNGNDFEWECPTEAASNPNCGQITGSYATTQSYDLSFTGLPMDEFGFEADALDLQISDAIPDSGTFDSDEDFFFGEEGEHLEFEIPYEFGEQQTVEIDDGGTTTQVTEVDMDPFPPGMSVMLAYTISNAMVGSGQENVVDVMEDALEDWSEDATETVEFSTFTCDNGEEIPADYVNDGEDDCTDGSDENVAEEDVGSELERRAMNIIEAFSESDFTKNLETFGERVEFEMEKYEDFEVELAYVDGDYNALWSSEHARFVGVQFIGEDANGNEFSILGPETDAYNNNAPADIGLSYLVGEAADEAEDVAEEEVTIEELAPVEEHDVEAVVEVLGEHAPPEMVADVAPPSTGGPSEVEGPDASSDGPFAGMSGSTILFIGGGTLVAIIVVLLTMVLVLSRSRGSDELGVNNGGYAPANEPIYDPHFDAGSHAAVAQPQSTMPSTLPGPQKPPQHLAGEMQQGYEVLEWPAESGNWWYRDQGSGQWIVWQ